MIARGKGMSLAGGSPRDDSEPAQQALELAIIVPTFNEIENIETLVSALKAAMEGHVYEIIVVDDDSTDGMADRVRDIAKRDVRVRCIQRIGRRGLSGAFIEGVLASAAPIVAVIDADMQHDEKLLPVRFRRHAGTRWNRFFVDRGHPDREREYGLANFIVQRRYMQETLEQFLDANPEAAPRFVHLRKVLADALAQDLADWISSRNRLMNEGLRPAWTDSDSKGSCGAAARGAAG